MLAAKLPNWPAISTISSRFRRLLFPTLQLLDGITNPVLELLPSTPVELIAQLAKVVHLSPAIPDSHVSKNT
jgi:hypothetical protein